MQALKLQTSSSCVVPQCFCPFLSLTWVSFCVPLCLRLLPLVVSGFRHKVKSQTQSGLNSLINQQDEQHG